MKKAIAGILLVCLLAGCGAERGTSSRQDAIPFGEDQTYAVAYLGYQQMDDLDFYAQQYLDSADLPIHYISAGDYYLVIPRYAGTGLHLYRNDLDTSQPILIYEDPDCGPFILQCNASDIFADATVRLTFEGEYAEFSPFISLRDGSVDIGEHGLLLTRDAGDQQPGA